ncbi:hypothetical protein ACROYT_G027225 [Oculina patagonica]
MEAIHDKETRLTEPFTIMTINMNGDGYADDRRKLISKITSEVNASVIFCQELPGCFEKEVVKKCGTGVYKFTPTGEEAAVIWRESDFHGDPVRGTDSSIRRIQEKLQSERSDIDVSEVHTRTAMVKLTSRGTSDRTGAPFLAVSWHGIYIETLPNRIKKFNGLILFVRKVCEMKKISSFIIGGDFNLNTLKEVNLTQLRNEGITVSEYVLNNRDVKKSQKVHARGRSFIPHKDNFVFTLAGDIIVSEVKPEELKESEALDHAPVVGILKLKHLPNKKPSKQVIEGTKQSDVSKKTAKEKNRPDFTPEKSDRLSTTRKDEGLDACKKLFPENDEGTKQSDVSKKTAKEKNRPDFTPEKSDRLSTTRKDEGLDASDLQQMRYDANKLQTPFEDLYRIASEQGFEISNNPGDGNCMFYALSDQLQLLKEIQISHEKLRKDLVQFLTENPRSPDGTHLFSFVNQSEHTTWSHYLESMKKDGTWGDELVLRAAADCYETSIRVISSLGHDNELMINPATTANNSPLVLGHYHELHYVSLIPRQGNDEINDSRQDLTPENSGRLSTTREAEGGPRRKLIFGNNDHLRETKFSGEPSKELASLPSDGQLLCEVQDDIYTWKFPLDCSQSTIDGRKRSYACSVISISIARAFLTTNIQPPSGEDLSSDWVNLLSQCMQEGNRLYDRTSASLTHRYLPAREAAGLFLVKPIVKVKGPYRLQLVSNRELSTLEKRLQMLTEANQRRATLFIFDNKAIIFLSCSKHSILAIDLHLHTTFGAAIIFAKRFSPDFISRLKEVTGMNDSTCGDFSQVIMYNDAN